MRRLLVDLLWDILWLVRLSLLVSLWTVALVLLLDCVAVLARGPGVGLKFIGCIDTETLTHVYDHTMSHLHPRQVPTLTTVRCNTPDLDGGSIRISSSRAAAEIWLTKESPEQLALATAHLVTDIRHAQEIQKWAQQAIRALGRK